MLPSFQNCLWLLSQFPSFLLALVRRTLAFTLLSVGRIQHCQCATPQNNSHLPSSTQGWSSSCNHFSQIFWLDSLPLVTQYVGSFQASVFGHFSFHSPLMIISTPLILKTHLKCQVFILSLDLSHILQGCVSNWLQTSLPESPTHQCSSLNSLQNHFSEPCTCWFLCYRCFSPWFQNTIQRPSFFENFPEANHYTLYVQGGEECWCRGGKVLAGHGMGRNPYGTNKIECELPCETIVYAETKIILLIFHHCFW